MPTDELQHLFTLSDPYAAGSPPTDELTATSVAVASAVVASERVAAGRARTTRRRSRLVALALTGAVVVPTGAWAADRFLAQTGMFGSGWGEEVDRSEIINLCATDFAAYLRSLPTPEGALPAGHTWPKVVQAVIDQTAQGCARDGGVLQQETGLKSTVLFHAQSLWTCEAVKADDAHDPAGVKAAGQEVAAIYDRLDAMNVFADSNWKPLRDSAAAGDAAFLRQNWAANGIGTCE